MKVTFLHGDISWKASGKKNGKRSFTDRKFRPRISERLLSGNHSNTIIAEVHAQKKDERIPMERLVREFKAPCDLLKSENIVILPYAHQDENTKRTMDGESALEFLNQLASAISESMGKVVPVAAFGVDKEVTLRIKSHRFAAHFRNIKPRLRDHFRAWKERIKMNASMIVGSATATVASITGAHFLEQAGMSRFLSTSIGFQAILFGVGFSAVMASWFFSHSSRYLCLGGLKKFGADTWLFFKKLGLAQLCSVGASFASSALLTYVLEAPNTLIVSVNWVLDKIAFYTAANLLTSKKDLEKRE